MQREQRAIGQDFQFGTPTQRIRDMGKIRILASRIDDKEQRVGTAVLDPRRHQVIADAAGIVQQERVTHLACVQAGDIAWHKAFEKRQHIVSPQDRLPHMGDVEQAGRGTGMLVFGDNAVGVLDRHGIARKRHHAPTAFDVKIVQGRFAEIRVGWC